MKQRAALLAAMSNPARLEIVSLLAEAKET
jgi:DNA-binding transcriptional ArsR family regulator